MWERHPVYELAAVDQKQVCLFVLPECLQENEKVAMFIEHILQGRSHRERQLPVSRQAIVCLVWVLSQAEAELLEEGGVRILKRSEHPLVLPGSRKPFLVTSNSNWNLSLPSILNSTSIMLSDHGQFT